MTHIAELQQKLKKGQAILVLSQKNRLYLTRFESGDAGTIIITPEKAYFLIDFRYIEKAKECIKDCDVIMTENFSNQVNEIITRHNITDVYTEVDYITVTEFKTFQKLLSPATLHDDDVFNKEILTLRRTKTEDELEAMKKAQKLTDETFSYILPKIKEGVTERELALEMEMYMRSRGSEGVSFDFIVVGGENSSLPHGTPTDRPFKKGDFITMDFGAVIDGYHSDMTRTVALAPITDEQKKVYDTVLKAQKATIEMIKAGVTGKEVDATARDIINEAGYEGCFGHGLGHSVGVEIHESPACNQRTAIPLIEGDIMTVEPGIYLEGKYGVRIEDMVFVTKDGVINLTESEKELILL
jgi:Xaa-Pro aminopeptidase